MKGNIKLAYSPIPEDLYQLFTSQSKLGKVFRRNIRASNTKGLFTCDLIGLIGLTGLFAQSYHCVYLGLNRKSNSLFAQPSGLSCPHTDTSLPMYPLNKEAYLERKIEAPSLPPNEFSSPSNELKPAIEPCTSFVKLLLLLFEIETCNSFLESNLAPPLIWQTTPNFSFTSIGVTVDNSTANMTSRVYTFHAHGGIYHKIDQLVPRDRHPRHLQLYFYDDQSELSLRLECPNLDRRIVEILTRVLSMNPYVVTFRSLVELGPLDNYRVTLNASVELD
ncbi:hypothetical protein OSB04_017089 [Centaurea solstitialis]|uniref:Uncharacterized protein n=1 Tax=Centaurea solstitialis TaxID=347529 RepID=A0AA38T3W5_9ASTR|nr:hypothetical protein OSB04_017089 [Centaurea solstitialis]